MRGCFRVEGSVCTIRADALVAGDDAERVGSIVLASELSEGVLLHQTDASERVLG